MRSNYGIKRRYVSVGSHAKGSTRRIVRVVAHGTVSDCFSKAKTNITARASSHLESRIFIVELGELREVSDFGCGG